MCLRVCASESGCSWRPEPLNFAGAGVVGSCEQPTVGAVDPAWVLYSQVCAAANCCLISLAPGGGSFDLPFKASWSCARGESRALPSIGNVAV